MAKCPKCDGRGSLVVLIDGKLEARRCHVCQGKCFVDLPSGPQSEPSPQQQLFEALSMRPKKFKRWN